MKKNWLVNDTWKSCATDQTYSLKREKSEICGANIEFWVLNDLCRLKCSTCFAAMCRLWLYVQQNWRQVRQAHCTDKMPKSITCQRRGELEKHWYSLSRSLCLFLFLSASSLSPQRVCYRFPLLLHCKKKTVRILRQIERVREVEKERAAVVLWKGPPLQ